MLVSGVRPSNSVVCVCVCVYKYIIPIFFFRFFSIIGYYKILSIGPSFPLLNFFYYFLIEVWLM